MGFFRSKSDKIDQETKSLEERIQKLNGQLSQQEKIIEEQNSTIMVMLETIANYANGNFDAKMPTLPGKFSKINDGIEHLQGNLISVKNNTVKIIKAVSKGEFDERADISHYKGDWLTIMGDINKMVEAIDIPLKEITNVMVAVADGHLTTKVKGSYEGRFNKLKQSVNSMTDEISSYIEEIADVLGNVSQGNLTGRISRSYRGDFASIKNTINRIIHSLHEIMQDIDNACTQVVGGTEELSRGAETLSSGTLRQSSAIDNLYNIVQTINSKTKENAQNANRANELATDAKKHATVGYDEMSKMLEAISGIKNSSDNISKIIKTIDSIAFQTNLLALNAAVEAARANEHGKGFAVVAEEVRSLAGRSQKSAGETAELIAESKSKVDEGTSLAQSTNASLQTIVEEVEHVSAIIAEIAAECQLQTESILNVSSGLEEVREIAGDNSVVGEQTSTSVDVVNNQMYTLEQKLKFFKLLPEGTVIFRLSHQNGPKHPLHLGMMRFKEEIHKRSNGYLICEIYDQSQIGNDVKAQGLVVANELEAAANTLWDTWSGKDERANLGALPFVFNNYEEAWAAYNGELGRWVSENIIEPQGVKVIGYWTNGLRHFTNNVRPIVTPEDMRGLKMRSPQTQTHLAMYKAFNADSINVPFNELYDLLASGKVDGQDNPLGNIHASKFYHKQAYLSLSNHMFSCGPLIMSRNFWNSLSEEHKQIIIESSAIASRYQGELTKSMEEKQMEEMRAFGTSINKIDVDSFKLATEPIWQDIIRKYGKDFINLAKKYVKDTNSLAHKYGN